MAECVHGLEESQCDMCSKPRALPLPTIEEVRREFLAATLVDDAARTRAEGLADEFAQSRPAPDPKAVVFRDEYAEHFSKDGLARVTGEQLRRFANSDLVAHPGNMSNFNDEWNKRGDEDARERVVETISYLLYGPEGTHLEDRLSDLILSNRGRGFRGLKESLLTKVLCMVHPNEFLPILIYSSPASYGKKELAEAVFGVMFPKAERTKMQIGRLVIWSNERLIEMLPDRFRIDLMWASEFLWWAKEQPWPFDAD